ncbi:MAG: DNA polymerase I [Acidobacteria bacterium]|nr:DNA polymerase I [Acidobacteriota bacterium]
MAAKLYLVDGMSHIYRAYHAIPPLTNAEGLPTNAVYGFVNMLRKLIKEEEPDYLGVAIDLFGPTVRHQQYKEYKATRPAMPEDLVKQLPLIMRVCEVLRIPVRSYERYEADDVIGTLARKAVKEGLEVVIVTIDKDMFQLVNDHVAILDTRSLTRLDSKGVEEKFGVPPEKVVDVLSLVGDSSDNIPGAPGIGQKGARELIKKYGSLTQLLARRDEVSRKSYRESLQQNESLIQLSHQLVTIHQDLPLELCLPEMKVSEPDREAARDLFVELEFTNLLEELIPPQEATSVNYRRVESREDLQALGDRIKGSRAALALLYASGDYREGALQALSVTNEARRAWYLPEELWKVESDEVSQLFERPEQWVIHDLKPLCFFAKRQGWKLKENTQDTMLMAYLAKPNQKNFSLTQLGLDYLQHKLQKPESDEEGLFGEQMVEVLCEQADVTFQLYDVLRPQIREKDLEELLEEVEIPLVPVLARMEEQGVKVNCDLLKQMSQEVEGEISRLTREIYEIADEEFNLNSPRQLSTVLFEKLHLPVAKKTSKGGHYATGVEVLEGLAETYEIAGLILDYRELSKLKNTYLDALPRLVNSRTGRIHTSYNQMVAATGRLSSSNPNLQNIPIKSKLGRKIRLAFISEPGYQILAADYSQIELRVMAHLSQDPVLVEAFLKGEDIHERTAREVFGMNAMMNSQEFRRHAKVINFGIMYGLSAFGLAQSLKINRKEAQQFIDSYFKKYQGVRTWIDRTLEEVYEKGYVKTLFGRIRQIPEIRSKNRNLRNFAERTAINTPIQGTAADLIKKAMVSLDRELSRQKLKSRLISQVHDELLFEVEDSEVEKMKKLVKEKMEGAAELRVPLQVDLAVGPSWLEAK